MIVSGSDRIHVDRVRLWAHHSAHANKYDPWSKVASIAGGEELAPAPENINNDGFTVPTTGKEKSKQNAPVLKWSMKL
jgi:hypothetical protein